jgi:lipoate-protein ligase A
MDAIRLLVDPPLSGPANMALDELLLTACSGVDPRITLRFYAWRPPTISLGYFQEYAEFEALGPPLRNLAVVRRTTGGGAILHDLEVTYSLVAPIDHPLVRGRPNELYRLAHEAVICAVAAGGLRLAGADCGPCGESSQRGPFFCFARRHALDVVVDDPNAPEGVAKLAGSAQRRTAQAILQHGSIILDRRFDQQPCATWKAMGGVERFEDAVVRLTAAFERTMGACAVADEWRDEEIRASEPIMERYCGDVWTVNRQR